ncbi:neugrin [Esox lucius]|uniref:Neugrin n=1 Tax=Esox lucius TaxID=8010 RepID=A0A6Q2YLG4_ESOLU|nr:neugrin [Esox lucius]
MLSLRMVALVASRLGPLPKSCVKSELSSTWSFIVSAKRKCSRHANRDANRAWTGPSHSQTGRISAQGEKVSLGTFEDKDPDMEDVDEKIQAVLSEERRRHRKLKYHIIKRQMSEPGAPERRLTWEAMEQIRYLKRELPEEWTIDRLAEGFSVHRDVILRVLKSRFTPTPERRAKQDASVWARLRQQALNWDGAPGGMGRQQLAGGTVGKGMQLAGGTVGKGMQLAGGGGTVGKGMQLALPGGGVVGSWHSDTPATLPTESGDGELVSLSGQSLTAQEYPSQLSVSPAWHSRHASVPRHPQQEEESAAEHSMSGEIQEDFWLDERWDGKVFSEDELEELMVSAKPSLVVQKGTEFFDSDGNFLYRI